MLTFEQKVAITRNRALELELDPFEVVRDTRNGSDIYCRVTEEVSGGTTHEQFLKDLDEVLLSLKIARLVTHKVTGLGGVVYDWFLDDFRLYFAVQWEEPSRAPEGHRRPERGLIGYTTDDLRVVPEL